MNTSCSLLHPPDLVVVLLRDHSGAGHGAVELGDGHRSSSGRDDVDLNDRHRHAMGLRRSQLLVGLPPQPDSRAAALGVVVDDGDLILQLLRHPRESLAVANHEHLGTLLVLSLVLGDCRSNRLLVVADGRRQGVCTLLLLLLSVLALARVLSAVKGVVARVVAGTGVLGRHRSADRSQ